MKKINLLLMVICFGLSYSQTIQSKNHDTIGYIKPDGTIQDSKHSTAGYIKSDGNILNKNHSTNGFIESDSTIQDKNHSTGISFIINEVIFRFTSS